MTQIPPQDDSDERRAFSAESAFEVGGGALGGVEDAAFGTIASGDPVVPPENAPAEAAVPAQTGDEGAGTSTSDAAAGALRRRLMVGAGVVVAIGAIIGVMQGFLWAWVVPKEEVKVFADGSYAALPTADFHPFVDLALFVLFGITVGLISGAAAWQARTIRGVTTLLAVLVGSLVGAALAYWIGPALASGVNPASVGATGHEQIVIQVPRLSTALVILAQPAFATAVYTFLAAWNGRPDLGRVDPAAVSVS
jgi:hypothetical protein